MNEVLTPELEVAIQELVNEILLRNGLPFVLLTLLVLGLGYYWIKKKLDGEVQKGVDKHKAEIGNSYVRQMENYQHYVSEQHKAYGKLNELLLMAEGATIFQVMRSYPDFSKYSEDELVEYLEERNATKTEIKSMLSLMEAPRSLQEQMQNYTERVNVHKARKIYNDLNNHYWIKALYFSESVSAHYNSVVELLSDILIIRENPENIDKHSREDMEKMRQLQKQIKPKIDLIIKQMKKELSAGLAE